MYVAVYLFLKTREIQFNVEHVNTVKIRIIFFNSEQYFCVKKI